MSGSSGGGGGRSSGGRSYRGRSYSSGGGSSSGGSSYSSSGSGSSSAYSQAVSDIKKKGVSNAQASMIFTESEFNARKARGGTVNGTSLRNFRSYSDYLAWAKKF